MANQFQNDGLNVSKEKVDLGSGQYTYNVIGQINGTDSHRYIIIGCHIDSPGSSQGAVDDAAGVGIEMEMAQLLGKDVKPNETVLLVGFGAEELWYNGSDEFVNQHPDIVANTDAMIDLNAVGAGDTVTPIGQSNLPTPVNAAPQLLDLIQQSANTMGNPVSVGGDAYPSDAYPFYNKNVSVVEVESQPFKVSPMDSSDSSTNLDLNNIQQMGETITLTILNLTNAKQIVKK
jgi:Zn-dependent M28 family amino/carboxypeptidase